MLRLVLLTLAAFLALAVPAHADPISMAIAITTALPFISAAVDTIVFTASLFIINTVAAVALSAIANKLLGSSSDRVTAQERQASILSLSIGEGPRIAIFGRAVTGGILLDGFNFGGANHTDWEVLIIKVADHKCDALEGFWIGDTFYAYSADGVQSGFNGQLEVYWKNGDPAQTASAYLITNTPNRLYGTRTWTSNDVGASQAYVIFAYKADAPNASSPVWPQGRPSFKAQVRGKLCYNPLLDSTVAGGSGSHRWATPSTWAWSENAAICDYNFDRGVYAKDLITDPAQLLVGRGLDETQAPPARVAARANVCDELVALKAGGTEPRYRVGCVVMSNETFIDIKTKFAKATAGDIVKRLGGVEVLPGKAQSVVLEITDDDWVVDEEIHFEPFLSDNDRVNTVTPHYIAPDQLWADHAAPVRRSTTDINNDKGQKIGDLALEFVTSGTQAQRCGEIVRRLARKEIRCAGVLSPIHSNLEDGDWIGWTSARRFGGGRVVFRLDAAAVQASYRTSIVPREIASTCYDWVAASDEGTPGQAPVDEFGSVTALTLAGATITGFALAGAGGATQPGVKGVWTTPVDPAILGVRLEVRKVSAAEISTASTQDPNIGVLYTTEGIASGSSVEARLVPVSSPGRVTTPTSWVPLSASDFVTSILAGPGGAPLTYTSLLNTLAPIGSNAIVNSEFVSGGTPPTGWAPGINNTSLTLTSTLLTGTGRAAKGAITGTPAGSTQFDAYSQDSTRPLDFLTPVLPGDLVGLSARAAYQGLTGANIYVMWYDGAGAFLSAVSNGATGGANVNGDTVDPGAYGLISMVATAPSNARWAQFVCRGLCNGSGVNPRLWFTQPMLARLPAGQTTVPVYTPGPAIRAATANVMWPAASSAPGGAQDGDGWPDTSTSPTVFKIRIAGTFVPVSSLGGAFGTTLFKTVGGVVATLTDFETALGVASAISGQGPLATAPIAVTSVTQPNQNLLKNPTGVTGDLTGWSNSLGALFASVFDGLRGWGFLWTIASGATFSSQFISDRVPVGAGVAMTAQLDVDTTGVTGGSMTVNIACYNAGGGFLGTTVGAMTQASGHFVFTGTTIASTAFAGIILSLNALAVSTGGTLFAYKAMLEKGSNPSPWNDATTNTVNPAIGQVLSTGSIPPTVPSAAFTYTSTTSSVTISWTAMTIYRADGTTIAISSGSTGAISSLSASTSYKVYPYMNDTGGTSGSVSFVTGGTGVGSTAICYPSIGDAVAAAAMYARGHIPLNGFIVATPAAGGGSGGGGGFGCLHPSQIVGNRLAGDLKVGDRVKAPDDWAKIAYLTRWACSEWFSVQVNGGLYPVVVTGEHRFVLAAGGEVKAKELRLGQLLATSGDHAEVTGLWIDKAKADLVCIELEAPHLYYLGAADLLCHNPKP